jgi:hypothetical protein
MDMVIIFALAFLTEGLTEYLFADLLFKNKKYLKYVSALIGVGLCLCYKVDALSLFFSLSPQYAILGQIFTGIALGRGANFLHDLYSRYGRRG